MSAGAGRVASQAAAVAIVVLATLAIGSALIVIAGESPLRVWTEMGARTFGDSYALGQILLKATTLMFTGLAVAMALDAGLLHIGAESQLVAGSLTAGAVGAALPSDISPVLALPLVLLCVITVGAALGLLIGAMRVWRGAHEVITGILLNVIVAGVALWIGNHAMFTGGTTRAAPIAPGAELPAFGIAGSAANAATLLALLAAVGVWLVRSRTRFGAELRAVGLQPAAAQTAGVAVARVQLMAMALAGALAALAASNLVLGHKHAFEEGLGRGTGYLGVAVALLGRRHPAGVVVAALGLALLSHGGLAVGELVPKELIDVLIGAVVVVVAVVQARGGSTAPRGGHA